MSAKTPEIRIRRIFSLLRQGITRPKACERERLPLPTLRSWIDRSRRGDAPAWVAEEWDEICGASKECDLCGKKYRSGTGIGRIESYEGAKIDLSFCSHECEHEWDTQEQDH